MFKVVLWLKKISFIFSSDFETMFTKHSPSEILNLTFEKMTVYLLRMELISYAKHEFENLKAQNSRAAYLISRKACFA